MSLIVATSRIEENTDPQPSERASNFTNFFRSPIEIEADSEIAVDSVKIQRTGNVTIDDRSFFCHYFGIDPDDLTEDNEYDELSCISRTISPNRGTYALGQYVKELTTAMNSQYDDPRIYNNATASVHTNASGAELGLDIQFTDRGSASSAAVNNVTASLVSKDVFNILNPQHFINTQLISDSSQYTWTPATGVFARTGATSGGLLSNSSGVAILTGRPFGLNEGRMIVNCSNASAQPWAIGLSRPQLQVESNQNSGETNNASRAQGIYDLDWDTTHTSTGNTIIRTYDSVGSVAGTHETYDFVVMLDEDDEITIAQRVFFGWEETYLASGLQELEYWETGGSATSAKMTKTAFHTSYDGIKFEGTGDQISVFFKQTNKSVFDQIVGSNLGATGNGRGRSFSPISSTQTALYPMINIGAGEIKITKYESNYKGTDESYKFPLLTGGSTGGYTPGSDMFSNETLFGIEEKWWVDIGRDYRSLASNTLMNAVNKCDSGVQKQHYQNASSADVYTYVGLNAANGVDFKHIITMNKLSPDNNFYTLTPAQNAADMSGRLGFFEWADIISNDLEGYADGDDTLVITFTSTGALALTSQASFIRLPALTHKSYNGAQSGISKIVYQLPQFSNDGRQFGALFFQPGEKTYVKLNNPAPMLLNTLQVQIVDAYEKELKTTLTGDTQIVFHIRKRR